jgi:hypothetical protein
MTPGNKVKPFASISLAAKPAAEAGISGATRTISPPASLYISNVKLASGRENTSMTDEQGQVRNHKRMLKFDGDSVPLFKLVQLDIEAYSFIF